MNLSRRLQRSIVDEAAVIDPEAPSAGTRTYGIPRRPTSAGGAALDWSELGIGFKDRAGVVWELLP